MPDLKKAETRLASVGLNVHRFTGYVCIALLCGLVLSEIAIVLLRYIYGVGFLQLQDFASYSFASLVVLGIPYAMVEDAHVRVDVFRERQTLVRRQAVDRAAVVLLLLPVFLLTLVSVWPDMLYSWSILEGSRETGGLPGLFLVKTTLPLACVLMLLQGMVLVMRRNTVPTDAKTQ